MAAAAAMALARCASAVAPDAHPRRSTSAATTEGAFISFTMTDSSCARPMARRSLRKHDGGSGTSPASPPFAAMAKAAKDCHVLSSNDVFACGAALKRRRSSSQHASAGASAVARSSRCCSASGSAPSAVLTPLASGNAGNPARLATMRSTARSAALPPPRPPPDARMTSLPSRLSTRDALLLAPPACTTSTSEGMAGPRAFTAAGWSRP